MSDPTGRAEIIAVGHELLMGEIVDTNTSYLAARLAEAGFAVDWTSQVGDDLYHLTEALERALSRSQITVTAGGLGPTRDHLTREAVARVLGEQMRVDPTLLEWLRDVFARRGISMPDTNLKQAALIPSAEPIPNALGTAPGWWVRTKARHVVLLPGPPREISRMW
ncbi:MAG: competence/damage-inducible protein A, partial [Gemmatimonadetes bacterium]|nr:competence/damage-inducible protein A [Gemmatimonadota bacterium]